MIERDCEINFEIAIVIVSIRNSAKPLTLFIYGLNQFSSTITSLRWPFNLLYDLKCVL